MSQLFNRRPLPGFSNRRVGDTDQMELKSPRGHLKVEIFADTETYYHTNGVEPWNNKGKPNYTTKLKEMDVYPFIFVYKFNRGRFCKDTRRWWLTDRWITKKIIVDDYDKLEEFFDDLAYIYHHMGGTPVLYFHNANYDLRVLEPLFKFMDPDMVFYFYTANKSKKFIGGKFESQKYNFYCELGDTLLYDPTVSIEKAGEMFEIKKKSEGIPYGLCDLEFEGDGTFSYTEFDTGIRKTFSLDKYLDYAVTDVDIMAKLHRRMKTVRDEVNGVMFDN